MKPRLMDMSKPHSVIYGDEPWKYEQDGIRYKANGTEYIEKLMEQDASTIPVDDLSPGQVLSEYKRLTGHGPARGTNGDDVRRSVAKLRAREASADGADQILSILGEPKAPVASDDDDDIPPAA